MPPEETADSTTERVCAKQIVARVCSDYPMLTLHFAGFRIDNGKSFIIKSWNIVRRKSPKVPIFRQWDTIDYLLERNIIHFRCSFQQQQNC